MIQSAQSIKSIESIESNNTIVNLNEQNKINLKKIKYKLKNVSYDEYIKNSDSGCFKAEFECSYDFLLHQYGKPFMTNKIHYCSNSDAPNPVRASWYIKVKTSNNHEYYIDIYDWEQSNIELKEVKKWCIAGSEKPCEYLNWDKLLKLLKFQYSNYIKRMEKLEKKEQEKINKSIKLNLNKKPIQQPIHQTIQETQTIESKQNSKFIDEQKYKKLDEEKLKEFTDDDLACVLFTRFKESGNFLLKEALVIHRALQDPTNYNRQIETKPDKKDYKNKFKTYSAKNISDTNVFANKKNKSKYNNKKDKSKYNNKKDKIEKVN